jgi:cyclopropane-fatty-acyl-phospholipid synthase
VAAQSRIGIAYQPQKAKDKRRKLWFMSQRLPYASLAQSTLHDLFASADIRIGGNRPWDIRVHDERFFRRVLTGGTLAFGESYMDGWWDCNALDEMCCRALRGRIEEKVPLNLHTALAVLSSLFFNLQTRGRARVVGKRHYDVGNDFFECMLDPAMQYSCAYFRETSDLAQAQREKMDLICRKLGLQRGMRLLDIGCGWGGLAKHAAENYGCRAVGITISEQQGRYASEACRGLPVEIRLQDYREVKDSFDRVVSVGMLEHVGAKNYKHYMETVFRCLEKDGIFLCQSIAGNWASRYPDPWFTRYIFPNSMLPSPAQVIKASEKLFVLEDAQNFGADYEKTLLAWEENFERSWDRFKGRYGERFYRMWRFYLLSCAGAFRARKLQLFQFLFSKGDARYLPARTSWLLPQQAPHSPVERPISVSA